MIQAFYGQATIFTGMIPPRNEDWRLIGMEQLATEFSISCHSLAFARNCDLGIAPGLHDSRYGSAGMALDKQWNRRCPKYFMCLYDLAELRAS